MTNANPTFDNEVRTRTIALCYRAHDISGTHFLFEEGDSVNGIAIYINSGNLYVGTWSESSGFQGTWISTPTNTNN